MKPYDDEMLNLLDLWAFHFGYYDGCIDLKTGGNLTTFATSDCTLTAHAPLWGTKPGKETATPIMKVRKTLASMLKLLRIARHDMHIARHPEKDAVCLYFIVKLRFFFLPFNIMTVPVALVVNAQQTKVGLRISHVAEWPAKTPQAARKTLIENCSWPTKTEITPLVAFGAVS